MNDEQAAPTVSPPKAPPVRKSVDGDKYPTTPAGEIRKR